MRWLLDTNVLIQIRRHRPESVMARFRTLSVGSVGMSVITFGELRYGLEKSGDPRATETLAALADLVPVLELGPEAGVHYGTIRATLAREGRIIGNNDLWIAAHALALGVPLVSNNTREFARVPGLKLENWI